MAATRELYPLPVHAVLNHPAYVVLPAAGRGMLLSLLEHYWRGGCRWFPPDGLQQSQWARAHMRSWKLHKVAILEIFDAARPSLDAYYRKREGAHRGLISAANSSNASRRLKVLRENTARSQAIRLDLHAAGMTPKTEPNPTARPPIPDKRGPRPKFAPKV